MSDGVRSSSGRDPDDDLLLCAFVVCGVDRLPLGVLAAASETHGVALEARLERLAGHSLVSVPGAWTEGDTVMVDLRRPSVDVSSVEARSLAARIGRYLRIVVQEAGARHAAAVPPDRHDDIHEDRLRSVRWPVVGVIRWQLEHGMAENAVHLARAWWTVAGTVADPAWMREFAEAGERAAIEIRDPAALIGLLTMAAECADRSGDWLMADARWVRVLSLARAQQDHDVACKTLATLGDFYRRWGRLHRAMDVLSDLIATCDRVHDNHGALRALRSLASVLLDADRATAAVPPLVRAVALAAADDAIEEGVHADLLIMLGRAYWMSNRIRAGREAFSNALALLVDVDADGADHVRSLLATPDDGSLPVKAPDVVEQHGRRTRPP
ncbi:hypothetical protein P3102_10950 [Amycolatopsis sp. QT-25]|uniref:hypothetical protein n=1 Tax=Amycolatopsis sp. QT-25 TaxID=3034022 RepID=UPI0023ED3139|nr:hypothetical protein [Amycolatopsis sp. QT-25]WET81681.1 hypothetical protein P3102_10950 [Amycolatopsis sp. QT-25]